MDWNPNGIYKSSRGMTDIRECLAEKKNLIKNTIKIYTEIQKKIYEFQVPI